MYATYKATEISMQHIKPLKHLCNIKRYGNIYAACKKPLKHLGNMLNDTTTFRQHTTEPGNPLKVQKEQNVGNIQGTTIVKLFTYHTVRKRLKGISLALKKQLFLKWKVLKIFWEIKKVAQCRKTLRGDPLVS